MKNLPETWRMTGSIVRWNNSAIFGEATDKSIVSRFLTGVHWHTRPKDQAQQHSMKTGTVNGVRHTRITQSSNITQHNRPLHLLSLSRCGWTLPLERDVIFELSFAFSFSTWIFHIFLYLLCSQFCIKVVFYITEKLGRLHSNCTSISC